MKRRLIPCLILLSALLASCVPATASPEPAAQATPPPDAFQPTMALPDPTLRVATQAAPEAATALPVATSRGPDLHATDPGTVSLASGGLQFVEFFRFT